VRCCCALGPRSQPAGSTCCTSSCGSTSCLIRVVAVALTAAGGGATRRGVWCERLVRSEPMLCGTGRRATRRHATQGTSLYTEEVRLHLLSARPYRGHRKGAQLLSSSTVSRAALWVPPSSKDQAAGAAATTSRHCGASRGATTTAAASCQLEVPHLSTYSRSLQGRSRADGSASAFERALASRDPERPSLEYVRHTPSTTNTSSHPV
jgi:hypothetical protein